MTSASPIIAITAAAQERFGEVVSITLDSHSGFADFYIVACKRREHPFHDRPFMLITARIDLEDDRFVGRPSFHGGHYDLSAQGVTDNLRKRLHIGRA